MRPPSGVTSRVVIVAPVDSAKNTFQAHGVDRTFALRGTCTH